MSRDWLVVSVSLVVTEEPFHLCLVRHSLFPSLAILYYACNTRKYPLWITACTACNYIVYIMYMQTKDVNIRIDRKTYKKLKIGAAHEGITLKELVDSLCDFL